MDPLSALGVASAAVQFLDFGSSVFSDFKEIYESSSGQSREVVELSTFSDDLARLAGEIEVRLNNARLQKSSRYEKGGSGVAETVTGSEEIFYRLCRSCREIEAEIQQRVAALRATGSNTLKLFTSGFITAIKTVWSENEIRKFKERLYQVRQQMMMTILVHFWYGSPLSLEENLLDGVLKPVNGLQEPRPNSRHRNTRRAGQGPAKNRETYPGIQRGPLAPQRSRSNRKRTQGGHASRQNHAQIGITNL